MELKVKRNKKADKFTAGRFSINGVEKYFTIEDTDRGLSSVMNPDVVGHLKVFAQTAIPTGRYEVVVNFSNHFQKNMPLLIGVVGFEGVRIHSGNKPEDTEGCILIGYEDSSDGFMGESRHAYEDLMTEINKIKETEKIFITIE